MTEPDPRGTCPARSAYQIDRSTMDARSIDARDALPAWLRPETWPPGALAPSPEPAPDDLDVFVAGTPRPQGSKNYLGKRRNGSAILVESADVKPWRYAVEQACRAAGRRFAGPVSAGLVFVVARPKRPSWEAPAGPPDLDKLARAVLDALQEAEVVENDSRVVRFHELVKRYARPGEHAGAWVNVRSWSP